MVLGVVAAADVATTADCRYADRGARTQQNELPLDVDGLENVWQRANPSEKKERWICRYRTIRQVISRVLYISILGSGIRREIDLLCPLSKVSATSATG